MNHKNRWFGILGTLLLAGFAAGQSSAQSGPPPAQMGPPPSQGDQSGQQPAQQPGQQLNPEVARISLIRGDVSTQRADSGDWAAATLNTPVMPGDKISTAEGASAELQLDYANVLRLSGASEAHVAVLTPDQIQVQVAQGLVNYSVFKGGQSQIEIDTPNVAVHPLHDGSYRIQVNSAGETVVIVREGEADVTTPQGSTKAERGQMVTIRGDASSAQYQTANAPSQDTWDKWNDERNKTMQDAESWSHVNPYYTGANDLDNNGDWSEVPDYGQVWTPNVDADWAPYTDGNWVNEPYYGWTWVSYEPWGWAPYHYGRWFRNANRWSWWPGPVYAGYRPIWSPAYVSFFGFGGGGFGLNLGFGFGFGSVGWLPIGPCDPFFPWWGGFGFGFFDFARFGRDPFFYRGVRGAWGPLGGHYDARFSNFHQIGHDPGMLRGLNSERASDFGHGAVAHSRGISESQISSAHGMNGRLPMTATHASYSATNRAANPSTIRNNANTHFFSSSRTQSSATARSSFSGNANVSRGSSGSSANSSRSFAGSTRNDRPPASRTFESQGTARSNAQASAGNGGWHSFTSQPNQANGERYNGSGNSARSAGPSQPRYEGGSSYGRGSASGNVRGYSSGSRPPLNMSRPIINQRSAPSNNYRYSAPPAPSRPSYSGGGGSARPSYSGGGGSRPSGGGGSHSSGGSHGGGGGHHR